MVPCQLFKMSRSLSSTRVFDTRLRLYVCLGVVICLGLQSCEGLAAVEDCSSPMGLCVRSLHATTSKSEIQINAEVSNVAQSALRSKAWWVLAPLGVGAPWERSVFQSSIYSSLMLPRSTVPLVWSTDIALPSGFYDLALIVHRVNPDGTEVHSDARLLGPIYFQAPSVTPWLIRRQGANGAIAVTSVSGTNGPGSASRMIGLSNAGAASADVSVQLTYAAVATGWEDRWWLGDDLYSSTPKPVALPARGSVTVTVQDSPPTALLRSFPAAQVWVVVVQDNAIEDRALLGGPDTFLTLPTTLFMRKGLPSGPAEVYGVNQVGPWTRLAKRRVVIRIANLTATTERLRVLWYLAPLGDARPWSDAVVGGAPMIATVGPWATADLTVVAYSAAPRGSWELSVWAHYASTKGTFSQTDAVWVSQPVSIT
jgi:hypothetical protein